MQRFRDAVKALSSLALLLPASAAACTVPGAYATLQAAVDDLACTEIELAAGFFPSAIVDRDVTIHGLGRASSVIQGTMTVNNDAVLSLRSLRVESGGSGGILLDSVFAELDGEDIEISDNVGSGVGFGPTASDSVVTLRDCTIWLNNQGVSARIIDMDNCSVNTNSPLGGIAVGVGGTIRNSTISSNQNLGGNRDGGGILFDGPGGTALTIEDSTITGNHTNNTANNSDPSNNTADGGGIMLRKGFLFLRRSEVTFNTAGRFGGGVALSDVFGGVAEIEDSTISSNTAYGAGGGIAVLDRVEVSHSLIEGNRAWYDGDINTNGLAAGGGIYVQEDSLTLTDSTVRDNKAETSIVASASSTTYSGGGLYISSNQPVTIERSTISGNFAEADGGGVFVDSSTTMINVTIAENRANEDGGGVFGQFTPVLRHATVVENTADDDANGTGDGGGLFNSAQVNHSLIGYNTDESAVTVHPDCSGSPVSTGYSFIRVGDGCAGFDGGDGNVVGTAASPLDLMLVLPIDDNGGPTQTAVLAPGSPARDMGEKNCELVTATDQRGYSRIAQDGNGDLGADGNYCDIGAVEAFGGCQAAPLVLSNITYSDARTVQSESMLSTRDTVLIAAGARIVFEAGSTIAFGSGFRVEANAEFRAVTGPFSCT